MAKKVVRQDTKGNAKGKNGKPVKKKRHGCRNCLISLLVFFVLLGAAGYLAGNFFTRKYLDMSLWDCFGVIHDLRSVKAKKIVTNGYDDSDYAKFETELRKQLFINDQADFDVNDLLDIALGEDESGADSAETRSDYLTQTVEMLGASMNKDALMDELGELYVRKNIDIQRLKAYDKSKHDTDYVFKVTDKMLAALINKSLDTVMDAVGSVGDKLKDFDIDSLSDVARLDQIIFGETDGTKDGVPSKVTTLTVTVSVNVRSIAKSFLKEHTGHSLGFAVKTLLPKRVYATAVVPLESGAELENNIYINNMNDKKMNRAFKLVGSVTSLTGEKLDVKEKISSAVGKSVSKVIDKVQGYIPLENAKSGAISIDVFEAVIDLSKLNENSDGTLKEEDKQLHASDVIATLAGVLASEADDAIVAEYDYSHQYLTAEDEVVYVPTVNPGDKVEGMDWVDYREVFMDQLAEKYMLDLKRGTPEEVTFDKLMSLFGLGQKLPEGEEIELLDLFDAKRLNGVPEGQAGKVNVDSRTLGAILQSQIDTLITDGGSLGNYEPTIEYVVTYKTSVDHAEHTMLRAAISIKTEGLVPSGNVAAKLIAGLMGSKAVITFDIDITPVPETEDGGDEANGGESEEKGEPKERESAADEFKFIEGKLVYNGLSVTDTESILRTVGCFVSDFDKAALLAQIEAPIRDAINKMNDVIEVKFVTSRIDVDATGANLPEFAKQENGDELALPNLFETVKQMMFADDDATNGALNREITPEGIEAVLRAIEVSDSSHEGFEQSYVGDSLISTKEDGEGNLKPDYSESFDRMLEQYYVKNEKEDGSPYTEFDELFGANGIANADKFDSSKFEFTKLYHDSRTIEELEPVFTDNDLAALMLDKMEKENSNIYSELLDVRGLRINADETDGERMTMYVRLRADSFIGDSNSDKKRLLPADTMYLCATVYLGEAHIHYYDKNTGSAFASKEEADEAAEKDGTVIVTAYYDTTLTINEMDAETYGIALKMIRSLNGGSAGDSADSSQGLNLDATSRDIGAAVFGRLEEIEKSLGSPLEFVEDPELGGGIKLVSVYGFIKNSLAKDDESVTEESVKKALQGLAVRRSAEDSANNYDDSVFKVNLIESDEKVDMDDIEFNLLTRKLTSNDNVFGRGLRNGFEVAGVYSTDPMSVGENFDLAQLNILAGTLSSRDGFFRSYYLEGEDGADEFENLTGRAFVEFTFDINLQGLANSRELGSALGEVNDAYVTVIFERDSNGEYREVYYRINCLDSATQRTLLKLAHIEVGEGSEVAKQIKDCENILNNSYNDSEFEMIDASGVLTAGGFGKITFDAAKNSMHA